MSTAVLITLIICGTCLLLSIISIVGAAVSAKKATKKFNEFTNDFFKEDNK